MKKLISTALTVLFLGANMVNAQTDAATAKPASTKSDQKATTQTAKKTEHSCDMKNCCMMKDGKMVMYKDGKEMPMTKEMTCANGMKCMPDGTCIDKSGKKSKMKNGECCDMSGNCMMPEHHKEAAKPAEKKDPAVK